MTEARNHFDVDFAFLGILGIIECVSSHRRLSVIGIATMALLALVIAQGQEWEIALLPLGVDLAVLSLFLLAAARLQETMTIFLPVLIAVLLWFAFGQSKRVEKQAMF